MNILKKHHNMWAFLYNKEKNKDKTSLISLIKNLNININEYNYHRFYEFLEFQGDKQSM